MELSVIIPTYNEAANVLPLFNALRAALGDAEWEAVFVDDDSPDGTADHVRALMGQYGNVRLLQRIGRRGLAGACIEGISSSNADFCAVIDADLQHDETCLPLMLAALREDAQLDLVIGSRHTEGGSASSGFSSLRRRGSDLATALTRRALRITVSDPMSGFFMIRRTRFEAVSGELQSSGFKILADMLSAARGRWKIIEIPYEFRSRQQGESKLDAAVTMEFLSLIVARLSGGLISIRFILFAFVGLSGVFVQLFAVWLLGLTGLAFALAQSGGVIVAIFSNFTLNNALTYRDRSLRGREFWHGLWRFYLVCALGALFNIGVAQLVHNALPGWFLASLAGAIAGALWNFVASARFTWRAN